MAEYIDKQKYIDKLDDKYSLGDIGRMERDIIVNELQWAETADVQSVVFCRDCKHSHMTYGGECKYCDFLQEDGGDALYLPKGFFCAAGERNRHESPKD